MVGRAGPSHARTAGTSGAGAEAPPSASGGGGRHVGSGARKAVRARTHPRCRIAPHPRWSGSSRASRAPTARGAWSPWRGGPGSERTSCRQEAGKRDAEPDASGWAGCGRRAGGHGPRPPGGQMANHGTIVMPRPWWQMQIGTVDGTNRAPPGMLAWCRGVYRGGQGRVWAALVRSGTCHRQARVGLMQTSPDRLRSATANLPARSVVAFTALGVRDRQEPSLPRNAWNSRRAVHGASADTGSPIWASGQTTTVKPVFR